MFLERNGYDVKGEICGCDVVAVRGDDPAVLVVAELKLSFTLELVLQAVDRLRCAHLVYLATVATRNGRDRDARVLRLCRLLGIGLLVVDLKLDAVTILTEPAPYRPRTDLPRRSRILKEHAARKGDPTQGGSSRRPIMTAYRQRAIACAQAIGDGIARPRELKHLASDAGTILLRNVHGWFVRDRPGVYKLSGEGKSMLLRLQRGE
jgi:hypothetical protein